MGISGYKYILLYSFITRVCKHKISVCQVTFSMMEIYNEQVRDLLNKKKTPTGGLKIKEAPNKGFYGEHTMYWLSRYCLNNKKVSVYPDYRSIQYKCTVMYSIMAVILKQKFNKYIILLYQIS